MKNGGSLSMGTNGKTTYRESTIVAKSERTGIYMFK